MGSGVGVLAVVGVDAPADLVEFAQDAVLFAFEQGKRDRVGVVGLQEPFLLVLEAVAVGGELCQFVDLCGHEPVELVVQHPGECFVLSGGDLDALVEVLDQFLDIGDEDRAAVAVGPLGVPAGADEVAVDVAVSALRVGHDEAGATPSSTSSMSLT